MRLDQDTLRTGDLPGLCRFFETVFDLQDAYRRAFCFPGHWLHDGDEPPVHVIPACLGAAAPPVGPEGIDHVAFQRADDALRGQLEALGLPYSRMELPGIGARRPFLRAPGGALIEVAFRDRMPTQMLQETIR